MFQSGKYGFWFNTRDRDRNEKPAARGLSSVGGLVVIARPVAHKIISLLNIREFLIALKTVMIFVYHFA
jgi:hypothetical protein